MSNIKTYVTKKGSILPLMKLKGKDYMLVSARLVWLTDEVDSYSTEFEHLVFDDEKAAVKCTLTIFDKEGKILKRLQDVKMEHKKDFNDYLEKSFTGALGRCLSQAGFGTAYSTVEIDPDIAGHRIVDAPLEMEVGKGIPKTLAQEVQPETSPEPQEAKPAAPKAKWTPKKKSTEPKPEADGDGW